VLSYLVYLDNSHLSCLPLGGNMTSPRESASAVRNLNLISSEVTNKTSAKVDMTSQLVK